MIADPFSQGLNRRRDGRLGRVGDDEDALHWGRILREDARSPQIGLMLNADC
jgi:hypothetical protein